jgi:hypothetical protein
MTRTLTLLILLLSTHGFAQSDKDTTTLSFGAYADGYYSYYTNANSVTYQVHDAIGAFHNNFGLNIGQLTSSFDSDRLRGVLTAHFGDIPQIAWSGSYRYLQEANAGVRLAKGLWLDMGFFKTHVGTESFLPKDNHMSIITLGTFYGPFYQSGARLSYDTESEWHFEAHVINGYNLHIDNNEYKTFGLLVSHPFSDHMYLSYSAMAGQENVGQLQDGFLIYQNIYTNLEYDKVDFQIGLDVSMADNWKTGQGWLDHPLIAGLATMKYHINEKFSASLRAEIFSDESSINSMRLSPVVDPLSGTSIAPSSIGMTIYGGTVGLEYQPIDAGFFRIESRMLYDPNATTSVFPKGFKADQVGVNPMLNSRLQLIATAGIYFDKTFKFAE